MRKIIYFTVILQIIFFTGCRICIFEPGRSEYQELAGIPMTNKRERIEKMDSYPVEKQIDVFLYAAKCAEDPSITGLFGDLGAPKITQIAERIKTSRSAEDKYHLIRSVSDIDWKCRCINQTIIDELSKFTSDVTVFDSASEKSFKEIYKDYLKHLKECRNSAECYRR